METYIDGRDCEWLILLMAPTTIPCSPVLVTFQLLVVFLLQLQFRN